MTWRAHMHSDDLAILRYLAEMELKINPGNWYAGDVLFLLHEIEEMKNNALKRREA